MPSTARASRPIRITLGLALVLSVASPVSAVEAGAETGEVVFRVTLSGPVDPSNAFVIWSRCPDAWCQTQVIAGGPVEHPVVACGRGLADQVTCTATTYEWTVELVPGTLEYRFERLPNADGEVEVLHIGSWEIHSGRQVLSFSYVYPAPQGGKGQLPDTAVAAP